MARGAMLDGTVKKKTSTQANIGGNSYVAPNIKVPTIKPMDPINIPQLNLAQAPDAAPSVDYTQQQVAPAPAVAPAPIVTEAPKPTAPAFKDWLNSDGATAAGKAGVDQGLQNQLASMLADRNAYQRDNTQDLANVDRAAPEQFEGVAGDFGARGLLQSSLYDQADDQAYQGVETQRQDLRSALADYMSNYDSGTTQRKTQAETDKRNLEAQAMQRYTQQFQGFQGLDTSTS